MISYELALKRAVEIYLRGTLPVEEYRRRHWIVTGPHHIDEPATDAPCCAALTSWAGTGVVKHMASAKHIANVYGVDRLDLLREANERFVRGRGLRLVS